MKNEDRIMIGLTGAILVVFVYVNMRRTPTTQPWARHIDGPSIQGAALQSGAGMLTPDHLLWWGPPGRPADWSAHRVKYPTTPGYELERLMHGAPGSCVTPNVPRAQRAWLFEPPSEVDY